MLFFLLPSLSGKLREKSTRVSDKTLTRTNMEKKEKKKKFFVLVSGMRKKYSIKVLFVASDFSTAAASSFKPITLFCVWTEIFLRETLDNFLFLSLPLCLSS